MGIGLRVVGSLILILSLILVEKIVRKRVYIDEFLILRGGKKS